MSRVFYIKDGYAEEFSQVNNLSEEDGCVIYSQLTYIPIRGKFVPCLVFDGEEINGCWQRGDYQNAFGSYKRVPDFWEGEDLRQGEVIYRPIKEKKD